MKIKLKYLIMYNNLWNSIRKNKLIFNNINTQKMELDYWKAKNINEIKKYKSKIILLMKF